MAEEPKGEGAGIHVVFAGNSAREQLQALAADLLTRREAILEAWRAYGEAVPGRNVGASLSRAQFNDHIPDVLDRLAHILQTWPEKRDPEAEQKEKEKVFEHGLQRWQQGYQLDELIREWGYLQMCVAAELERYAASHESLEGSVMPTARRLWMELCSEGVTGSATQYSRLQQSESAGHVSGLEQLLPLSMGSTARAPKGGARRPMICAAVSPRSKGQRLFCDPAGLSSPSHSGKRWRTCSAKAWPHSTRCSMTF